jgi:hypothetical protein
MAVKTQWCMLGRAQAVHPAAMPCLSQVAEFKSSHMCGQQLHIGHAQRLPQHGLGGGIVHSFLASAAAAK